MSTYLERLELYFEANAVTESRKVSVLLTVNRAKAYSTLHSLVAPNLPHYFRHGKLIISTLQKF